MIQLTQEQRQAFKQGHAVRLHDAELGSEVVVCPVGLFEEMEAHIQEMIDNDEEQEWMTMSKQTLARQLKAEGHG